MSTVDFNLDYIATSSLSGKPKIALVGCVIDSGSQPGGSLPDYARQDSASAPNNLEWCVTLTLTHPTANLFDKKLYFSDMLLAKLKSGNGKDRL
jgi:hypothetical protein